MPGTFEADDFIDLHDNPFEVLAGIQESWRQKDRGGPWSAHRFPVLDLEDIDWHSYDPPAALRKTPDVTSQILLDIVSSSIENIKVQAANEARQKQEEEEQSANAGPGPKLGHNGDEPYLPIIIREERPPTPPPEPEVQSISEAKSSTDYSGRRAEAIKAVARSRSPRLISLPTRPDRGRKLNLRRFFGRANEKSDEAAERARLGDLGRKVMSFSKAEESGNTITWDPATGQYKRLSAPSAQSKPNPVKTPEPPVELV